MDFFCKSKDNNSKPPMLQLNSRDSTLQTPPTPPSRALQRGSYSSWVKPRSHQSSPKPDETSCQSICPSMPIIHPFGPFRIAWDSLVILALLYTSIEVPYTLAFGVVVSLSHTAGIVALLIDMFLLCDIILNFRTGYIDKYDHLHIITSPKCIAKKYLKSWFWLDLFSSLPLEFLIPTLLSHNANDQERKLANIVKLLRIFRLLRGLKMLRVLRVIKLFKGFGRYVFVREAAMVLKCVRCLAAMLITAHYFACFWYLVGWQTQKNGKESWIEVIDIQHDNPSNWTKYSYSWYWAIVTLFTTGYGDIVAHNEEEQWTASVCILIGTCFFAYFIGVLTNLLEEGDRVRMYELERVEEAQLFCSHHRLPRQLARAIVTHIRYHCNYNYLFDHQRIMQSIPTYLQNHITNHLSQSLMDLDIFKHLPPFVVGQIALKMTSTSCNSGHTLFKKGELSHEFYIQRTGRSILHRTGTGTTKTRILERGDVCGEYVILSGQHRDTVKCITWSEFYVLDMNDLLSVLRDNLIDPKAFLREFRHMKTVLRKTLQKATKRKVKFRTTDDHEEGEFIHECLSDATASTIYQTAKYDNEDDDNEHKYEALNPPNKGSITSLIELTSHKLHNEQLRKMKSTSSGKLMKQLSGIFQRENSLGRHEIVMKKPNALSMDMGTLDTSHREFEYSDHEDSHFFSDHRKDSNHDIIHINRKDSIGHESMGKGRIGGKFGGKKRAKTVSNHPKRDKMATLLYGLHDTEPLRKLGLQRDDTSNTLSGDDETDVDDGTEHKIEGSATSTACIASKKGHTHTMIELADKAIRHSFLSKGRSRSLTHSDRSHGTSAGTSRYSRIHSHEFHIETETVREIDNGTDDMVTPMAAEHFMVDIDDGGGTVHTEKNAFLYSMKDVNIVPDIHVNGIVDDIIDE